MHGSHLRPRASIALAASLSLATIVAACGPAAIAPSAPNGATPSSTASVGPTPSASTTATSAPAPSASAHGTTTTKPPPGPMKEPVATAMAGELQAMGLDPAKLPPMAKLDGEKLRRVMKLFTRSLGVKCGDCHSDDFSAQTPMTNIAVKMWDDFSRGLALDAGGAVGGPIFCDSCHNGHAEFLDRHDMKALGKWMDAAYVGKLARRDGKEHECSTCHGDPFEGEILKEWSKGATKPGAPAAGKAGTPAHR